MSADLIALAQQLRDSGKLRWYPGMRAITPNDGDGWRISDPGYVPYGGYPDLSDPLTAAALLLMAREAWAPSCRVIWAWLSTCEGWIVTDGYGHRLGGGPTELEALAAAILSAPVRS